MLDLGFGNNAFLQICCCLGLTHYARSAFVGGLTSGFSESFTPDRKEARPELSLVLAILHLRYYVLHLVCWAII